MEVSQRPEIRRDPPRLVLREQLGRRSPAGIILEIEAHASFWPVLSITTKHASNSSIFQGVAMFGTPIAASRRELARPVRLAPSAPAYVTQP
jgi:hypothetical protein